MDANELQKAASRKKLCSDADKISEKVSHASKKIIKLKVAQDSAYWFLKQRLRQTESNYEKLQQNMVDIQMQYEAVSSQYQEEIRLRPETVNKLAGTRKISEVIENYMERLRDTMSRYKEDQIAVYEAHQKSGQVVRDLKAQLVLSDDKNRQVIDSLQDKLRMSADHNAQLQELFSAVKQCSEAELVELRSKLSGMLSQREEMLAARNELERKLEQSAKDVEKKQEIILSLQKDIKQLIQEFHSEGNEMKNINLKLEKDIKEVTSSNEALKQALANQEAFTKDVCDQNNQMLEKVAALEEEKVAADVVVKDLEAKVEVLSAAQAEISNLTEQLSILDTKNSELTKILDGKVKAMAAKVQQLITFRQEVEQKIHVIKIALEECRDAAAEKIEQLTTTMQVKDEELVAKAAAVDQLTSDLQRAAGERCQLETDVQMAKTEMEVQKDAAEERERMLAKKVDMLEGAVKNKDAELNEQMNVILELRNIKDRLRDTIDQMQLKFDNVQMELSAGPSKRVTRLLMPEHDDNAVMITPGHEQSRAGLPGAQRSAPKRRDVTVYNFSDDSSDSGKTIDPVEVNRRFEAICRGEPPSPLPPSFGKRRKRTAPRPRAPRAQPAAPIAPNNDEVISMTDMKDNTKNYKANKFFKSKRN